MTRGPLRQVVLVLIVTVLAAAGWSVPARAQLTLEDAVVRAFDITADLRPEPFGAVCEPSRVVGSVREPRACRINRFGTLRGKTAARFEVTSGTPVSNLRLFLDPDLTIRSISGPPLNARQEGFYTVLVFNPALAPGSVHTLTFEYEGKVWYVWDDLIFVDTGYLYPQIISPFGDFSVNRATIRTAVTVPSGYLLASTGRMTRTESGGAQTYTWEITEPLPYMGVVGGKVFRAVERKAGNLELQILVRPQADRYASQIADYTLKAAEFYSRLIYPFPFDHLTVIADPLGLSAALGQGYPSLMILVESAFAGQPGSDLDRDSFRLLLVAHEAAHTYVPAQTSPRGLGSAWLSEGFAEYLGMMTVESVMGRQAFRRELDEDRRWYGRFVDRDKAITSYTRVNSGTGDAIAVRYAKGAFVLHMLRFVVGDETFQKILSTYFTRFRGQSVRVDDFTSVASEVAGRDLSWFFREWVSDLVLPDYTITEVTSVPAEGAYRITAKVRNLSSGAMPVEVLFDLDNGERVSQRVDVGSRAEATVTVTAPRPARRAEADPDKWILQRNYTNDAWTGR